MDYNAAQEIAVIGILLRDEAYMAWAAAEWEAEQALCAWINGVSGQGDRAYQAYRAAVDREEAAAHDLERLYQLTAVCEEAFAEVE